MGLKGNLSTVSLAEVFQTLSTGNSTGLLRIQAPEGPRFVEMKNGAISIAGRSAGRVMLGDLLISRGLIDDARLDEALRMQKESGKMLGEVLIESGAVSLEQLENALRFQIEEEVCELFTLKHGDFDFLDGAGLDSRMAPAGGLVRVNLNLTDLLAEAARRAEEWQTIEQRIPSQSMLFETSAQGDELLKGTDGLSPEGMILLRLAKTHRTVEAMVQKACLGRFTTNRMLLELWDANIVLPAPMNNYERAAKEHLRLNRLEETQRIAELMVERGNDEQKEQGKALMQEISRTRKPTVAPTTSSAYVKADPKVRSEVIRRHQAGLILKKEKSYTPVIIMALVVLGGIGAGAYFMFFKGKAAETHADVKQLEHLTFQVNTYIADGKYKEGLDLLREFHSSDPGIQKQASDLFDKRLHDVEFKLEQAIDKFDEAQKAGKTDDIEKAIIVLQPMLDINVNNPTLESMRLRVRKDLGNRRDRQRNDQFLAEVKELEASKAKDGEALLKGYEELLSQDPPEAAAAKVRDAIVALRNSRNEARALLSQARSSREIGDLEMARLGFEHARQKFGGAIVAQEAEKAIAEINETITTNQAQFEKIQLLITQNKTTEAKDALLKFLDAKPPQHIWARALLSLHGLGSGSEPDLLMVYRAASAQWDKQPDDARKKIVDLVDKNPYSNTAAMAILKLRVTSQPDGANVSLNGKPSGTTPVTLDIPALGMVRVAITKEGFRNEEVVKNNFHDDSISMTLERLSSSAALLPAPASGGITPASDTLLLGVGRHLLFSTRDLKVNNRIRLTGPAPSGNVPAPPISAAKGEAYISEAGSKTLNRVDLASGSLRQIELEQPPTSIPFNYNNTDTPPLALIAIATRHGFESFKDEDGKSDKRVGLGSGTVPPGMAFDGEQFYLPRPANMLIAVAGGEGLKKWEANAGAEISGPPAYQPAAKLVAVASAGGRVSAFDRVTGAEKWKQELKDECPFGVETFGTGFLVVQKGGKVQPLAGDTGAPGWTAQLAGAPLLPPAFIRPSAHEKAVAVCTRQGEGADAKFFLTLINAETGAIVWRKTLDAVPVALAADEQRLYIATGDSMLYAFDVK